MISRQRRKIEALSPCTRYAVAAGINPFAYMLAQAGVRAQVENQELTEDEKKEQHRVKMASEQRAARARQQRKRNKV